MQKKTVALILLLTAVLLFIGLFPVHGESEIYDKVVRLHILANSDSEEDQALKLLVRDAILSVTVPLLEDCPDRESALVLLEENEETLLCVARQTLAENGSDDPVTIRFGTEQYPERSYDSVCFPAGEYLSLRVCIGEAAGHNWWCCLYPPLCLGTSTVSRECAEEAFTEVGLTPSQYRIITESERPVYRVRFKLLEAIKALF